MNLRFPTEVGKKMGCVLTNQQMGQLQRAFKNLIAFLYDLFLWYDFYFEKKVCREDDINKDTSSVVMG